ASLAAVAAALVAGAGQNSVGEVVADIDATTGGPAAATGSDGPDRLAALLLKGRSVTVLVSADLMRLSEARATLQQLTNLLRVLRVLG
ncbi:MAG: NADH dehydrogenase (quinone) subunit G, partial [Mesorhizobium sp.]